MFLTRKSDPLKSSLDEVTVCCLGHWNMKTTKWVIICIYQCCHPNHNTLPEPHGKSSTILCILQLATVLLGSERQREHHSHPGKSQNWTQNSSEPQAHRPCSLIWCFFFFSSASRNHLPGKRCKRLCDSFSISGSHTGYRRMHTDLLSGNPQFKS